MKRSEIIRLIQKEILSIKQEDVIHYSLDFSRELLEKLEAAGMQPPKLKVESTAFVTNPETGERGEFTSWTYRNKWEPEDV